MRAPFNRPDAPLITPAPGARLDVPERIHAALAARLASPIVADIVAAEMSVAFYALASWGRRPFVPAVPEGAHGFFYHKRSAYATILYALLGASLVEIAGADLVFRSLSLPRIAAVVIVISVLSAVWILGVARSVQLRPIIVTGRDVLVRVGVQWRLDIPCSEIERIEVGRPKVPVKGTAGYLRGIPVGQPNVLISLRTPITAWGPHGTSREVTLVSLVLDDPAEFARRATVPTDDPH